MNYKNRGMLLESIINKTLKIYSDNEIGIFHKKTLPITFSGIKSKEGGKLEIEQGWITSKSTADYYGIYKGIFIAFEAKSTNLDYLPIANIKEHQIRYLERIQKHGGLAFLIIAFNSFDEHYLITIDQIINCNSKSLSRELIREKGYLLELIYPGILDFAPILSQLI